MLHVPLGPQAGSTSSPFYQIESVRRSLHAKFFPFATKIALRSPPTGEPAVECAVRQMLLDLPKAAAQTLGNFEAGRNVELLALLQRHGDARALALDESFIYCWGAAGAGKSHLLNALATRRDSRLIDAAAPLTAFLHTPEISLYLLDDCDRLSAAQQEGAFALFNQVREHAGTFIATGEAPPAQLALREDLRTRLGWGLVYELHGLSDEEKIAALTLAAKTRGFTLASGVLPYLITHFKRDMRSLSAMLDALDRYSLETKRPVTLPLLRQLLQLENSPRA